MVSPNEVEVQNHNPERESQARVKKTEIHNRQRRPEPGVGKNGADKEWDQMN